MRVAATTAEKQPSLSIYTPDRELLLLPILSGNYHSLRDGSESRRRKEPFFFVVFLFVLYLLIHPHAMDIEGKVSPIF